MKRGLIPFAAAFLFLSSAFAGPLSNKVASYRISARLVPAQRTVEAREVLLWKNTSRLPVNEILIHLYPNAFRDSRSTYACEGKIAITPARAGGIELRHVSLADGTDLLGRLTYIQPDDSNDDDQTVARLELPAPVPPGETAEVRFDFVTRIPQGIGRCSCVPGREFYFVSQWFPKAGVLQEDGSWNCHQYHRFTEFFADFGSYHVEITALADFLVGATGTTMAVRRNGDGTVTYVQDQDDVHDFAWTASPEFVRVERMFHHPGLPPTRIILLLQPDHRDQESRHLRAIETALRYYGEAYGPYPYATLTVVDPPRTSTAAGMEYPTLIVTETSEFLLEKVQSPEYVIVHEFGHQYWYGMVATNEFEEPWLDEGITSYTSARALLDTYSPNLSSIRVAGIPFYGYPILTFRDFPLIALLGSVEVPHPLRRFPAYLESTSNDPIARPAYEYYDYQTYRVNAYNKPEIMLFTLERLLGRETMRDILKAYFNRWRFKHPRGTDFTRVAEKVAGMNLDWFFVPLLTTTGVVDYGVKTIDVREGRAGQVESDVVVWRYGEVKLPVEIRVEFSDGSVRDTIWDGYARWVRMTFAGRDEVVSAEVDPDHKLLLDVNITNNSYRTSARPLGAIGWATKWFFRPGTVVGILIVFVLEEAYIVAKMWSRLLFFASQLHMFRDLTASVIAVDVEELVQPEARA